MRVLYEDDHFSMVFHPLDRVVVARRKPSEGTEDEIIASMSAARDVDLAPLAPRAIIVDVRAVTGRSDPEFERRTAPLRRAITESAPRAIILVATVAGALQTNRLSAQEGSRLFIAKTEEEAFRIARGD